MRYDMCCMLKIDVFSYNIQVIQMQKVSANQCCIHDFQVGEVQSAKEILRELFSPAARAPLRVVLNL